MELKKIFVILPVLVTNLVACGGGEGNNGQDPLVEGFPIAYVKRPFPLRDADNNDQIIQPDARDPFQFYEGSDLYIRDHASAQAEPRNITGAITGGDGDVRDVAVSYDGKKLIFSVKKDPDDPDENIPQNQPQWKIWEYDIEKDSLRKISPDSSVLAHDIAPAYLADGRIVFSSTRQLGSRAVLIEETKIAYTSMVDRQNHALMLHVMDANGGNIRQITYKLGRDMNPYVRRDGKIIFSRWGVAGVDSINIYSVNPDGTDEQLLYGAHSHIGETPQFTQLREYPDGRVLSILKPYMGTYGGGDIGLIDTNRFADFGRPVRNYAGISGTGQESLTGNEASMYVGPSMGGRYISVYPLWDGSGRSLVSWSPCRIVNGAQTEPCSEETLANPDVVEAEPVYSLFVFDPADKSKLPIFLPSPGYAITDVVAAQARSYPEHLEDTVNLTESTGVLHIRSVYDYDGQTFNPRGATRADNGQAIDPLTATISTFIEDTNPDTREARFIRLIKPFVQPDPTDFQIPNEATGPTGAGLVEIIGYAPVDPDGSVKVRVPANVPFSFQIVDRNGQRIGEPRHNYWLTVRNGETLECNGCHQHDSDIPHGRRDAVYTLNTGAGADGPFPGQNASLEAIAGETMAETRTRDGCNSDGGLCLGLNPSVDLTYKDIWPEVPDLAREFTYSYADVYYPGPVPVSQVRQDCLTNWTTACRVTINYQEHIEPIWRKARINTQSGEVVTCSQAGCHSAVALSDPMDPTSRIHHIPEPDITPDLVNPPFITGSQINLDSIDESIVWDPVTGNPPRLKSYEELLFNDDAVQLDENGFLTIAFDDLNNPIFEIQIQVEIDPVTGLPVLDPVTGQPIPVLDPVTGQPIPVLDPVTGEPVPALDPVTGEPIIIGYEQINLDVNPGPPIRAGRARDSNRFFDIFYDTGDATHYDSMLGQGILSAAELRLISEWIDIGAQYINRPPQE